MADSHHLWTLVLVPTALSLSLVVIAQTAAGYGIAFVSAPREVAAFVDAADQCEREHEDLDRDLSRIARLDDRIRLGKMLRGLKKAGEDLREDLNALMVPTYPDPLDMDDDDQDDRHLHLHAGHSTAIGLSGVAGMHAGHTVLTPPSTPSPKRAVLHGVDDDDVPAAPPRLHVWARIMWAVRRRQLEDRVRRIDMLRMRFLVVYMGAVTAAAEELIKNPPLTPPMSPPPDNAAERDAALRRFLDQHLSAAAAAAMRAPLQKVAQQASIPAPPPLPPPLPPSATPPARTLNSQAIGHNAPVHNGHRTGWAGVVQELQSSPRMHRRHALIEHSMRRTTMP